MQRRAAFVLCALFLSCAGFLFPQDQAPRRILFDMQKGLVTGYSDDDMIILRRSFLTALADADGAPVPIDWGSRPFPSSLAERDRAAREAGADCWLVVKISGLRGSPSIDVVSYDLLYNMKTLDFSSHRSEAFSMLDIYRERWDDVVPVLVKTYPPIVSHEYTQGPPAPVALTIRAIPGTLITGLTPGPVSVGKDGTLTLQLPSPAPYVFRSTVRGYVPSTTRIYLDGERQLTVDQKPSPWLRLDGVLQDGFFPGLAANFSLPTLPLFARLGFTTFRAGVAVNRDQAFASLPLSQLTVILGVYISPEDSDWRWYFGAGPLLRVSYPAGGSLVIDQLLPFGVQVVAGGEFPVAGRLRGFLEYDPTGYYTPLPGLFVASFGSSGGTFPYINFPPLWALNPFEVRVGLRWIL